MFSATFKKLISQPQWTACYIKLRWRSLFFVLTSQMKFVKVFWNCVQRLGELWTKVIRLIDDFCTIFNQSTHRILKFWEFSLIYVPYVISHGSLLHSHDEARPISASENYPIINKSKIVKIKKWAMTFYIRCTAVPKEKYFII